jgi:hypothetical protein
MINDIFEYIGNELKVKNPWIDSFAVNCVSYPTSEGNRIVNIEGDEKTDFSFDDAKGYGFYIRTTPAMNFSISRRLTSCEVESNQQIDFTFVFFAINTGVELSSLKLLNLFSNNLRLLNFNNYVGTERDIRIQLIRTTNDATQIFKDEIGKDFEFGSDFVSVSVTARLFFNITSESCEASCLEDLMIKDCNNG